MGKNSLNLSTLLASAVTAVGITTAVFADTSALPRGADVDELAGNCAVGTFHQTTKAGPYNALCDSMEDAEICLGFLKQHFNATGTTRKTYNPDKMAFCVAELGDVLGATAP